MAEEKILHEIELEDLRDLGSRVISIGDNIDYPTYDDWLQIQFKFLLNEVPVTETSRKVKRVIKRRQELGKWICAVPYGYVITNHKTMEFQVDHTQALVVKLIFDLYKDGWGYKKIANYLTEKHYPTPRMSERDKIISRGEECKLKARPEWSIATIQNILSNDFYVGTLRQGKYTRTKINGADTKKDASEHIVFENHHEPIIDPETFSIVQDALKKRSVSHYRGVKKYENSYSGLLVCGDCGSPMFPMSRKDLRSAYRCGAYHQRGLKGCTSHHVRVDVLDTVLRVYLQKIRETSSDMLEKLTQVIEEESKIVEDSRSAVDILEAQIADLEEERKIYMKQCAREIMKFPEREESIQEKYDELYLECDQKIEGLRNQIALTNDRQDTIIRVNRIAKNAITYFDDIINKVSFDKGDIELIVEKIYVYEDHIHIKLRDDIEGILQCGFSESFESEDAVANFNQGIIDSSKCKIVQSSEKRPDKVYSVNVVYRGDPLEIYTDREGEVIFKKYSPIGELASFASQYAETLYKTCGLAVIICDRDAVIACAGIPKKEYNDRKLSSDLEDIMEKRSFYTFSDKHVLITDGGNARINCAMPIIAEGDIAGLVASVITDTEDNTTAMSADIESKLIQTAAGFLGRQLET